MIKTADLHIHTICSDGTQTPEDVVKEARQKGLKCIAITDHDTVEGIGPAIEAGKRCDVEVIAGVELSTRIGKKDIHILGYLFDYENKEFLAMLNKIQYARIERMKAMIDKLKGIGIGNIEFQDVEEFAGKSSLGRPHLAHFLIKRGWAKDYREVFDKYLAEGKPVCVDKLYISPKEGIDLINSAGGVAVLAHPRVSKVDEHILSFVKYGLGGIEVYYPYTPEAIIRFYEKIVKKHNLVATGGSDAHGKNKEHTYIGRAYIPYDHVEQLKRLCEKRL